jgi:hypothetical protein
LEKATESYSRRERNPLDSQKVETALIASGSPSAVTGKYLAVWEKIGNNRKLECRFEDQWARHWKKYIAKFSGRITVASKASCLPWSSH